MRKTVMAIVGHFIRLCSRNSLSLHPNQRSLGSLLVNPTLLSCQSVRHNANYTSITRTHRNFYARSYPTTLVQPDGSTIEIRYSLPRKIIRLPLDLSTLSEEERLARLAQRKPKKKVVVEQTFEGMYDSKDYSYLWKKKK